MSKQIIIDYQEYLDMQSELDSLRKPAEGVELTEAEHQEATGILVTRALQNPDLIRHTAYGKPINLGKYIAIFVLFTNNSPSLGDIRVKFERS